MIFYSRAPEARCETDSDAGAALERSGRVREAGGGERINFVARVRHRRLKQRHEDKNPGYSNKTVGYKAADKPHDL